LISYRLLFFLLSFEYHRASLAHVPGGFYFSLLRFLFPQAISIYFICLFSLLRVSFLVTVKDFDLVLSSLSRSLKAVLFYPPRARLSDSHSDFIYSNIRNPRHRSLFKL